MSIKSEKQLISSDSVILRIVDSIKKSDNDLWNYRGLELSNEMLVVLISHSSIDKAAAAINVSIGSLADPDNVPGIAHFLEHMLFMGSTKYPGENEYDKLIDGNGGYTNAFTAGDHTIYYFDINPSLISNALDIFAQFFISPLFSASSTDRELEAVNSEFEGNLFQDAWRIYQLDKSTSDSKHPFSKFSIGNIESLRTIPKQSGIDVRQILLNFHKNEYSSNRMSLAVIGNQSLDELQSFVIKSFKDVENKKLTKSIYPSDPYGENKRKTICYVIPVQEERQLKIHWVIPDYKELYYCKIESYLSHLIGHEGYGSLLSYLKKFGLATQLFAGQVNSARGFNFFTIDIELTIEGLNQWERVICSVYQYLAMLRKEEPKQWIFDELKNINEMYFQFKEKEQPSDFVSNLVGRMRDYPLTECLSGEYEMREFCPDLINKVLNEYLIPSKMRVFLISKEFITIATEKEKWFDTQYKLQYLSEELIKQCEICQSIPEFHLPTPNEFIPTDFHLFSKENNLIRPNIPTKIKENEFYRLYYAQDSYYKLPKACIYFEFRNPLVNADPMHSNMNEIYIELIDDALTETIYPAQTAGLEYTLYPVDNGIQLEIFGFNHKIKEFLFAIIDCMINIKIKKQQFEIIKEKVKRSLQNFRREVPYRMAGFGVTYLISEYKWNKDELLSCIDDITIEDVESFISRIFNRFYIDSLMYGNLTENQSIEYMTLIEQKFREKHFYQPLYSTLWFNQRELILPNGCNYAYRMVNDAHKLNAIEIYLQCFQQTIENNALIELFSHLVQEPCFNQLRTKEQLGYIVKSSVYRSNSEQGFKTVVQSSRELDYVNQRIELFIKSIRDYISTMPDELFKEQRQGYIIKKIEIPKSMRNQADEFWEEITNHQFCFNRPQIEIDIIKTLERNDLLKFYDHYISPNSIHRRKLSVHVNPSTLALQIQTNEIDNSGTENTNQNTIHVTEQQTIVDLVDKACIKDTENILHKEEINLPKSEWIDNVHIWKSKLSCYPLAQSYEKLDIPILYKL